jgi:hypothetical protein
MEVTETALLGHGEHLIWKIEGILSKCKEVHLNYQW